MPGVNEIAVYLDGTMPSASGGLIEQLAPRAGKLYGRVNAAFRGQLQDALTNKQFFYCASRPIM